MSAFFEYQSRGLSQPLGYPPGLIYLICLVQFACALLLLKWELVPWAAAVLTGITLGAVASHFRVGAPLSALPPLFYTAVQVWLGWKVSLRASSPPGDPRAG